MRKQATKGRGLSIVPALEEVIRAVVPRPLPTICFGADLRTRAARVEQLRKDDLAVALIAAYGRICALESKLAAQEGSGRAKNF